MKYFVMFHGNFLELPIRMFEIMKKNGVKAEINGLVVGRENINERLWNSSLTICKLDSLDALEKRWIEKQLDLERLKKYNDILGVRSMNEIIISDRNIGYGYVSGGTWPRTYLVNNSNNPNIVKKYLLGLLDYCWEVFENNPPDILFLYAIAGAPALALAKVAKHFNVKIVTLKPTRIQKRYIFDTIIDAKFNIIQDDYRKALEDETHLQSWYPEAQDYFQSFQHKNVKPDYYWYNQQRLSELYTSKQGVRHLKRLVRYYLGRIKEPESLSLRENSIKHGIQDAFQKYLNGRKYTKSWPFSKKIPDGKLIFYPLHVDPEASTMVLAPYHTNQLAVIENISKSIPFTHTLIVKEHLPMLGKRPTGFYEAINKFYNVELLPPYFDSAELIKKSDLTCVITGTAAMEALFLGKPSIVIGDHPFLMLSEGMIHCPALNQLPEAIEKGLTLDNFDKTKIIKFLAAVFKNSFDMPTDLLWGKPSKEKIDSKINLIENVVQHFQHITVEKLDFIK